MDAKAALLSRDRALPGLRDGENVLISTIISDAIYWKGIAVLIVAILFLLIAYQLTLFLAFVAALTLGFEGLLQKYLLLVVTNQRVLIRRGFLLTDMIQLQYSRIESVEVQTTLIGTFLGYSTLMVSGTGSRMGYIPYVANAMAIQEIINEILQRRDTSSNEYLDKQARAQAEALADVLDEHEEKKI